jgi:glycosyltransferase involved in cell wall biosynthesis
LRIAVLHNLGSGGALRVVQEHSRRLAARGHALRTFAPALPADAGGWASVTGYRHACRAHRQMAELINGWGCDAVYLHTCTWTGAPYAARFLSAPSIYYCQEPYFDRILWHWEALPQPPSRGRWFYRRWMGYRRAVERGTLARIARLLVNAEHMRAELEALWGRPATVCPLGVDAERFRPLGLPRRRQAISVGALAAPKGYRFLVDALGRIAPGRRPPLLIVANTESPFERAAVEELARARGVELAVRVGVGEEELVRLYNESSLMVYAPHREPFGLAALEAMACALPVVAVDEGGPREAVGDGGRRVARDPDAFAAAVAELLDAGAEEAGRRAREWVLERWSWEASVDVLEKELAACASQS